MRKRIFIALGIGALIACCYLLSPPHADAGVYKTGRVEWVPMVFKKPIKIGTTLNQGADSSMLVQIGDTACRGGLGLPVTDTSKISSPVEGVLIWSRVENKIRVWDGAKWALPS